MSRKKVVTMTEISNEEKAKLYGFAVEIKELAKKRGMCLEEGKEPYVGDYSGYVSVTFISSEEIARREEKEKERKNNIIEA